MTDFFLNKEILLVNFAWIQFVVLNFFQFLVNDFFLIYIKENSCDECPHDSGSHYIL